MSLALYTHFDIPAPAPPGRPPQSSARVRAAPPAAGAVAAAVRRVAAGEGTRAFCAVRPPGHHAGAETPMGFCLYANVAIGARVAQSVGLARVAVVDFDV